MQKHTGTHEAAHGPVEYSEVRFDSMADFRSVLQEKEHARHHAERNDPDFNGVRSYDEFLTLSRDGWEEHTEDTLQVATETLATVEREFEVDGWRSRYDVAGADVDVARYLTGEPENMITFDLVATPQMGRVVTIVANVSVSWAVDKELIIERGKALVALIHAIESVGLRVEAWVDWQAGDGFAEELRLHSYVGRIMVKAKDATDTMDPAALLYAFAHPSVCRVGMFAAGHELERYQRDIGIGYGYGVPTNGLETELAPREALLFRTGIASTEAWPADPVAFVTENMRKLGLLS